MTDKKVSFFQKRFFRYLFLIVAILLIVSFSRQIFGLLQAQKKIDEAKQRVEELEKEQAELMEKKEYYLSDRFIEEQARDKLNMAKEGEAVVIMPERKSNLIKTAVEEEVKLVNWQKWLEVFGLGK